MKIHFVISGLKGGGAERVLLLLSNALSKKGYQIGIITFNGEDAYTPYEQIERIRLHGGKVPNHSLRSLLNLGTYYRQKKNRPDLIISFMPSISFIAIIVAKLYQIKIIACEHINHKRIDSRLDQFTREKLYRFANFLTVLTSFDVDYYTKHKAKVVVMPNPSTFQIIGQLPKNKQNIILAVGSLDRYEHKGFDNLLDILPPLVEKFPEWKLQIVGQGEKGLTYLLEKSKQLNLQNFVEFLGFRKDVDNIMKASEIYVLPSRYEGLPMVLIEAMSQGMACIAYNCKTGPSDIISDGYNGLLIENQNKIAMQNGLGELMSKPQLRKCLGENALQSMDRFQIGTIVSKWEKLFENLNL
jgi:GalNAc-alpha-(1->4)-GalNAc-alpha-(1->3)-diNAcBac-PP-undecaprenol alpha-1,4-N-acetyl-D-galactosaminyltransferase